MAKAATYTVEQPRPDVVLVNMDVPGAGWCQRFLLRSDAHHDNAHCDQTLERRHLEEAKAGGAGIFDGGDLFCAMQGKYDRRADQGQLREELRGNDYLNRIVDYCEAFYKPYADNFIGLAPGNHETGVLKHHGLNLTQSLRDRLKAPKLMSYATWVGFRFTINKTKRHTIWMSRHHGYGGGGPVTRGVIQTNRMAVYLPDASIVWTGHVHEDWVVTIPRSRISSQGVPHIDEQVHVKTPGYKEEFLCAEGYHVEGGRPPKPLGAAWLEFSMRPGDSDAGRVSYEVRRAK
jgi:hypothetical protein